jgi:hypothetical protein
MSDLIKVISITIITFSLIILGLHLGSINARHIDTNLIVQQIKIEHNRLGLDSDMVGLTLGNWVAINGNVSVKN